MCSNPFSAARSQLVARGQKRRLRVLSGVIVRHCARTRPTRPEVSFAVGPTGVGKTRTAEKALRTSFGLNLRLQSGCERAFCREKGSPHSFEGKTQPYDLDFSKWCRNTQVLQWR